MEGLPGPIRPDTACGNSRARMRSYRVEIHPNLANTPRLDCRNSRNWFSPPQRRSMVPPITGKTILRGYPPLPLSGSYPNDSQSQPWITRIDPAMDGLKSPPVSSDRVISMLVSRRPACAPKATGLKKYHGEALGPVGSPACPQHLPGLVDLGKPASLQAITPSNPASSLLWPCGMAYAL